VHLPPLPAWSPSRFETQYFRGTSDRIAGESALDHMLRYKPFTQHTELFEMPVAPLRFVLIPSLWAVPSRSDVACRAISADIRKV
jgi:hypothetical protein